jgi:hypothetical protein
MDSTKEGVLLKWTNYIYGWKPRYFVLHDGLFEYCKEKGEPLKGKISLSTLSLKKHPKRDTDLIINTGISTINLRAYNPKEAQEWYVALKRAGNIECNSSFLHESQRRGSVEDVPASFAQKVSEMWSVHAMISESLDTLPASLRSKHPEIEKTFGLFKTFKLLASEALSFLESEETKSVATSRFSINERKSLEFGEFSQKFKVASSEDHFGGNEVIAEEDEESVRFEDARSHVSEEKEEYCVPHRRTLPFLRDPKTKYNIWRVVKDSIGKDLSKMAVPVYFNEPISFLQRYTEDLTYHEILLNACESEEPLQRLAYIACFAVTSYVGTLQRNMKPFNPLLGETYELVRDGYRIVCEQVSHHPPISAMHCEHSLFTYAGSVNVRTSFKGTHLCVTPVGKYHVRLHNTGDHFVWSKPQTNVHNIIFGKMYVDHFGKVEILNKTTGDVAVLNFHKKGWFEKVSNEVSGTVSDKFGNLRFKLMGQWHQQMSIVDVVNGKIVKVWEKYPFPEGFDYNYFFSDFAIQLNLPPEYFPGLPRTDSRFRPDQRALENGDLKEALSEKHRLEEKQREARRNLEKSGKEYYPMWFKLIEDDWVYSGGYWECRESGQVEALPDIF